MSFLRPESILFMEDLILLADLESVDSDGLLVAPGPIRVAPGDTVFICPECKLPADRIFPKHNGSLRYHPECWERREWRRYGRIRLQGLRVR